MLFLSQEHSSGKLGTYMALASCDAMLASFPIYSVWKTNVIEK
jgi:hypothetical protein